jgi:nicotinamidase-related amidase
MRYGVSDDWLYYAIPMSIGHESINLRAISIIGNMDLYVSKCTRNTELLCAKYDLPSTSNYSFTTAGQDTDIITIHRNDEVDTLYIVGAQASSYFTSYQISFTIENSISELQAGVSVMDHVKSGEFDYFSFFFDNTVGSIKITLSAVSI